MDESSHEYNIYALLCDWYWYLTHPDVEFDGVWHADEQGKEFADRVMAFIREELSLE